MPNILPPKHFYTLPLNFPQALTPKSDPGLSRLLRSASREGGEAKEAEVKEGEDDDLELDPDYVPPRRREENGLEKGDSAEADREVGKEDEDVDTTTTDAEEEESDGDEKVRMAVQV